MRTEYIELHARSAFSFLHGASTPEDLIAAGAELEIPAMALLDRDGVYGAPRFHMAAKKSGIKAHVGAEIAVSSFKFQVSSLKNREVFYLPLLVRNRRGYQNLCRLTTLMKLRVPKHAKPGECAVTRDELAAYAEGLVCLTGGDDGPLAEDTHRRDAENAEGAQRRAESNRAKLDKRSPRRYDVVSDKANDQPSTHRTSRSARRNFRRRSFGRIREAFTK
jgi:DNA polymerase III alpha subunit